MSNETNVWFAGTPTFAATALEALLHAPEYHVSGVLTQPDRRAGRGQKIQPSAVKQVAIQHQLPIAQPEKLSAPTHFFDGTTPDLIIVAAYGLLLPAWFLSLPKLGCINIHASLLPRWRGAAPIQRAIEAGDQETGISIMQMDEGLDTGDVWLEKRIPIPTDCTAGELHDALQSLGAKALLQALPLIVQQNDKPTPQQSELASYAHKLKKSEADIDWKESIDSIMRKIRAFNPFPIAQTHVQETTLRIHRATALSATPDAPAGKIIAHHAGGLDIACIDGVLRVTHMQLPGKPVQQAADLRHGLTLTGQQCH